MAAESIMKIEQHDMNPKDDISWVRSEIAERRLRQHRNNPFSYCNLSLRYVEGAAEVVAEPIEKSEASSVSVLLLSVIVRVVDFSLAADNDDDAAASSSCDIEWA